MALYLYGTLRPMAYYIDVAVEWGQPDSRKGCGWTEIIKKPYLLVPLTSDVMLFAYFPFDCRGRGIPVDGSHKLIRTYKVDFAKRRKDINMKDIPAGCCAPLLFFEMNQMENIPD